MKVNVKEVDIFKKMGNDDGDREGRSQQMTHQANLILQKANDEKSCLLYTSPSPRDA